MKHHLIPMALAVALLTRSLAGAASAQAVTEALTEAVTSAGEEAQTEDSGQEGSDEVSLHGITYANDYKEVFEALKRVYYEPVYLYEDYAAEEVLDYAVSSDADAADTGAAQVKRTADAAADGDYSRTNLREQGVDEADIVKTDGTYIYVLADREKLLIWKADGPAVSLSAEADLKEDGREDWNACDMYVDGDTLCIVYDIYEYDAWKERSRQRTVLETWDIANREAPLRSAKVWQDGSCAQSRKVGDIIYLYSTDYPSIRTTYEESSIVPEADGKEIPAGNVCIPKTVTDPSYLLVSSVDIKAPDQVMDTKVLVSGAAQMYVSENALYVMNPDYSGSRERTEIVKFTCRDGVIEGRAACYVKGYVNDSFSIDEYDGMLRVLTTYMGSDYGALLETLSDLFGLDYYDDQRWVRHNALYVLDEDLGRISRLDGIAENEEIRSARYFGDTVYFVTFETTDPLFTADLSDPSAPKLTGELKVTGFSSYLHPYGEGKLLGIGYEADEETGRTTGLKLSMFEVSDPVHVTECDRFVLPGITWCPAIGDYKSILADPQKNLIGFYCEDRYMVYSWDEEKGFQRNLLYDFYEDMLNGRASYDSMRGLYIGSELYLAGGNFVVSFDMSGEAFTRQSVSTR